MNNNGKWKEIIMAYLHDPPDKAAEIKGHESRAKKYFDKAFGGTVSQDDSKLADIEASTADRLPTPNHSSQGNKYDLSVSPEGGKLTIVHPLSGEELTISAPELNSGLDAVEDALNSLNAGAGEKEKFLALWRFLKEKHIVRNGAFAFLPADTRTPDHTIWNHLDMSAGINAAILDGKKPAFLSFHLGPVQPFIEKARTLRDLWTGSYILSWLVFKALEPVVDNYGPASVVFPYLREMPLLDKYLKDKFNLNTTPSEEDLTIPCMPNKFLAIVSADDNEIGRMCEAAVKNEWKKISDEVKKKLLEKNQNIDAENLWDKQTDDFFEVKTLLLPFHADNEGDITQLLYGKEELPERIKAIRELTNKMPDKPPYPQDKVGLWQMAVALSAKLMDARRSVRHFPAYNSTNGKEGYRQLPQKCSLYGSYEQMGPGNLSASSKFWENLSKEKNSEIKGTRIREGERLCAVALTKRYAWPIYLSEQLKIKVNELRFDDTATVAAANWLKDAKISPNKIRKEYGEWNGQWLHCSKQDQDEDTSPRDEDMWNLIKEKKKNVKEPPPTYYAVLVMDGDNMGKWLSGQNAPTLEQVYHKKIVDYFEKKVEGWEKAKDKNRPVSPSLHAAISEALNNFALHIAPAIVKKHNGELIYSGGDDVLALLPTDSALQCSLELYSAFRGEKTENNQSEYNGYYKTEDGEKKGQNLLTMGSRATLSAGISIVHHKEDLRFAIAEARAAEKNSKNSGRNILTLAVCKRSGEHTKVLVPWKDIDAYLTELVKIFKEGASNRWAYKLHDDIDLFCSLPQETAISEMKRLIKRSEDEMKEANKTLKLEEKYITYSDEILRRKEELLEDAKIKFPHPLIQFSNLIQAASFLARGREE